MKRGVGCRGIRNHFGCDFMEEILLVGRVFGEGSIYLYNLSFKRLHPSQAYDSLQEVHV